MAEKTNSQCAIVFGGAGFIGTHLLRYLSRRGDYKRLISYDIADPADPVDGTEYVTGDVREPIVLGSDIDAPDIYNLAAVHKTPGHKEWEYYWTNVLGATNVCAYAAVTSCQLLVFTSSISVYGHAEAPRDENSPLHPETAYGRSKVLAETIHRAWRENGPARRLVVARPAVVFGSGEHGNFTRLAYLLSCGIFVYPGRRDTIKSCCYVDEVVCSMAFACELNEPEFIYNCSYPTRITIQDICQAYADIAGFTVPKLMAPQWLMLTGAKMFSLLGRLGVDTSINSDRVSKLVRSTNIVPTALLNKGYSFQTDLREALRRWMAETAGSFT